MSILENKQGISSASQLMAIEVISELLVSSSPHELGKALTDHLRELTGAKTAMVLAHQSEPHLDVLLNASPTRRAGLFPPEELNQFCHEKTPGILPYYPDDLPAHNPLKDMLLRAGIQSMARFPLKAGGDYIGLLILFDLPGIERFAETTQILNLLAPPIALALKNALAYFQIEQQSLELEKRVEERTVELLQKNAELKQSEERFRLAIQATNDGLWEWDIRTNKEFFSPRWCEIIGYTFDDPALPHTFDSWAERIHPDDRDGVMSALKDHLDNGARFDVVYRHRHKSGEYRWQNSIGQVSHDESGTPSKMVGCISDLTEKMLADEALHRSEERYRTILGTTMEGFWLVDAGRYILEANDAYSLMSGYSKQELQGMHITGLEAIDTDTETANRARKIMEQGGDRFESQHRRKDGSVFFVDVSITYLPLDGGRFAVFVRDITERKQAEASLAESEYFFRASQSAAQIGSYKTDFIAGKWESTEVLDAIFGIDKNYDRSIQGWLNIVHPQDRELMDRELMDRYLMEEVISNRKTFSREYRIIRQKDGETRWVNGRGIGEFDDDGNLHLLMGTIQDITDRKKTEDEKVQLEKELQQAQKMESIGRLAGGVAHDFNNMLLVIMGHAQLGLMNLDPINPVCNDLKEISKSAERSADLTRQLLAFARKQTITPKVLDLNEIVTEMLKMLQRLIGEDIKLVWQPVPEIWQIRVDPSQIDQILANLCVNARDAIVGNGRITIETSNCLIDAAYCSVNLRATPGEYVCLSVSDSGSGMDKETQSHIFEPFYTTKELGKGTGLGLATVYGAVKQNNGFINIYSEPGQGTTFSIYLPRDESHSKKLAFSGRDNVPDPSGRETILLVEDEPAILNIASLMLDKQGYTVLKAETPGEAIRLAREHSGNIHLLMTDVIMPEMNGRDLAKNLLSLYPHMKRLFMSGYTADVIATHGVLEEGVHFIQKPFALPTMAAMVREVLDSE